MESTHVMRVLTDNALDNVQLGMVVALEKGIQAHQVCLDWLFDLVFIK